MQIHELNRPRRTDEGFMDVVKGVGNVAKGAYGAAKTAVAQAVSPGVGTTQDFRASSAGILKPAEKLAAVKKNSQMADLAAKFADAWLTDKRSQVSAAPAPAPAASPAATPAPAKTANFAGQPGYSNTTTSVKTPATTVKEAEATVAAPGTYNKKTGAAKLGGKTMTALSDLPPAVQQQVQAKQQELEKQTGRPNPYMTPAAQQSAAPAPTAKTTAPATPATAATPPTSANTAPAKTANFSGPQGYGTTSTSAKTVPAPQTATQPAPAKTANFAPQGAGYKASTQPTSVKYSGVPGTKSAANSGTTPPDDPEYIKNFLEFANEKVAMRDSTTYKMLGLKDAEGSELGPELDAAKQAVKDAQGNPANTKTAVKNYILTAMAALQLVASQNAVKAASPEAPAYGQQPAPAAGATGAAAGTAPATGQLTGSDAVALLTKAGLTTQILGSAGQFIQTKTGNKQLSKTGDSVIDTMLEGMGYTVS